MDLKGQKALAQKFSSEPLPAQPVVRVSRCDDRPLFHVSDLRFEESEEMLTVDDYPIMKTRVIGVTDEKENVHKSDKSDPSRPALSVDHDFPRVNITNAMKY